MNPLTLEWVEKAENDFATARRELRVRAAPNYDDVCFHAQQMAEKYLKGFLQENYIAIPKTHSLAELLALCLKLDASFTLIQADLNALEGYAVRFRYPGRTAAKGDAKAAFKSAEIIRNFLRSKLGLP
jgi:HEPN domain-containing protein